MTVNINVPNYLKEWAEYHFGSPVEFPRNSIEVKLIKRLLDKSPKTNEDADGGNLEIFIPTSKSKDTRVYNYLNPSSKRVLETSLHTLFLQNLWSEVGGLDSLNCSAKLLIIAWCEKHRISDVHEDTVAKKFYRIRKSYELNNINLQRHRSDSCPSFVSTCENLK